MVSVAPDQGDVSPVAGGIHVAHHAEHGGDADTACNENERGVIFQQEVGKEAIRSVDDGGFTLLDAVHEPCPVTAFSNDEFQSVWGCWRGGDGEWMCFR